MSAQRILCRIRRQSKNGWSRFWGVAWLFFSAFIAQPVNYCFMSPHVPGYGNFGLSPSVFNCLQANRKQTDCPLTNSNFVYIWTVTSVIM